MSIIYSYPEQGALNANDMLIGTSAEKVGGKQKNITRNFSVQQIADFINGGAGFIDPVASDFQIAVFNQAGKKITGSIMSQDAFPNGTGITISGNLTTTGNITTPLNLTANGVVSLGGQANLISLNSVTKLGGPIQDATGTLGNVNQILLSNGSGVVTWQNYEAGLTYEGTWDAANNTTNGLSNSPALVQGTGVSGHFYIVNAEGTTSLGPNLNDWHIGDWAIFLDEGGQPASWQKIDNTSTLVGSGTAGTLSKWTTPTTLNDSLVSETGTVVSINGELKVKDTVEATTTNSNLKLKGNGTGGVEIMSADGITDGKITLNCSQNSHGVTLQSPPHSAGQSYTLVLPTTTGQPADVLTSSGPSNSQLVWTTPTTGTVTGTGTVNYVTKWSAGGTGIQDSTIFDNGTNVGIGTATPNSKLEVADSFPILRLTNESTTTTIGDVVSSIEFYNTDTSGDYPAVGAAIKSINESAFGNANALGFFTNGDSASETEYMRIDSGGNVGIGTSSPGAKLEVDGDALIKSGEYLSWGAAGATSIEGSTASNKLQFRTDSADRMIINDTGVGIGMTSPYTKLVIGSRGTGAATSVGAYDGIAFDFYNDGSPYKRHGAIISQASDASESVLDFNTKAASGTNSTKMTILGNGNVGIGTYSPSTKLHVESSDDFLGYFKSTDNKAFIGIADNDTTAYISTENSNLSLGGNTGTHPDNLNWDLTNKRLGIGTTTPAVSLDISATDAVQMPVGVTGDRPTTGVSNGMLRYNSTNNGFEGYINGNWGDIGGGNTGGLIFRGTFDAATGAIAGGGSLYTCPAGGSGGTVDTAIGDLYIVTTAGSFFCSGTSLNVGDEVICVTAATATNDNVNNWNAIASGAGGAVTGSGTTNYVPKFTGATVVGDSSIFNDAAGNVGIGTASPSRSLTVNSGNQQVAALIESTSNLSSQINIKNSISNDGGFVKTTGDNIILSANNPGLSHLVVADGGNVGIGTTSPSTKLEVAGNASLVASNPLFKVDGSGHAGIMIDRGSTSYDANLMFATGGSTNWRIWNDGSNDTLQIRDEANSANLMTWKQGGNVGIGTASPGAKLDVSSSSTSVIRLSNSDTSLIEGQKTGSIEFSQSDSSTHATGVTGRISMSSVKGFGNPNYYGNAADMIFQVGAGNGWADDNATLDALTIKNGSGRVGIGTDSPEVSLDLGTKTDAIQLPAGDNTARAAISNPFGGMIRYNTTDDQFEGYSGVGAAGSWGAIGGGGASATITTRSTTTANATTTVFALGATPNGGSTSFVDVFVDGVYQEISTYSVTGTTNITFGAALPSGVTVETKTTADYNVGAAVDTVSLGQSNITGNVDLRINPIEVTGGTTPTGAANSLYIFTATAGGSIATVTLPASPTLGDSIKISNIGGLANVLGANGNKIMGVAQDMTINTPTAAFELIWSGSNNGWIIIGNV